MNAPFVWIVLPMICGLLFWFLRSRTGLVILLSTILNLALAGMAWLLPFGRFVRLGPLSFEVETTLAFAGRRLVLDSTDQAFLIFIYLVCAFWFASSYTAGAHSLLIPFGTGVVALLVASLAVEPFLYAALLIEMAVLLAVPVLAPPGKPFGQGVPRFVIFQTLAMPFILLAGWALGEVEDNLSNTLLVSLASIFLGLGFAFWLAVFPFYSWVPLLSEQSHPYITGFILLMFPTVDLLLCLRFLDQFGWLRAMPSLSEILMLVGVIMVASAGIWSAFQRDLSRLFGYAVIVETGFSVLAISLANRVGSELFASMFLPRLIALSLWALALSVILQQVKTTRFDDIQGLFNQMPFASGGLAVAALSTAGLPLLAGFPIRIVLMEELSAQSLGVGLAALAGSVGMLFSVFRALTVLARGSIIPQSFRESRTQSVLLIAGMAGLLIIGIFPQVFLPLLTPLLRAYPNLP